MKLIDYGDRIVGSGMFHVSLLITPTHTGLRNTHKPAGFVQIAQTPGVGTIVPCYLHRLQGTGGLTSPSLTGKNEKIHQCAIM